MWLVDRDVACGLLLCEVPCKFLLTCCIPLCNAMLHCSWGTGWGESGYLRMKKEPWLDGPNAPSGVYWRGIYSASRPIVGQGEWLPTWALLEGGSQGRYAQDVFSCCFFGALDDVAVAAP